MNRPIKFRAWLTKDEEMVDVDIVSWVKGDEFVGHGPVSRYVETIGGHARYEDEGATDLKDVVLMQFTGLSDKNGKEIWEGDIVQLVQGEIDGKEILGKKFAVEWDGHGFWYKNTPNECRYYPKDKIKVIGNIYENSDLLV